MEFTPNKTHKNQQVWEETAEMLDALKEIYNKRNRRDFGDRAKRVTKTAIIHNLVMMKLREEMENA